MKKRGSRRRNKDKASLRSGHRVKPQSGTTMLTKALQHRVFRFLVVGVVNTSFSYGVYALLLYVGLEYWLANFGSLILGILFSFKTQGKYVFQNTNNRLFLRFLISWGVIFVFNITLIGWLIKFGLNAYIAGAIALLPVTVLSYVVQKFFVFGGKKHATSSPVFN